MPLTELAGGEGAGLADTAPIVDFDISPDGLQVAFTTVRTRFPLGFPAFVSTPAAEPGMNELFDADLADGTLTRVTHGYQGADEAGEHAHIRPPPAKTPTKASRTTARSRPPSPTTAKSSRSPRPPRTSSSATATRPPSAYR